MEKITVDNILNLMSDTENISIMDGSKVLYVGYLGIFKHYESNYEDLRARTVKRIGIKTDISHRKWAELGLSCPLEPEKMPQFTFSDLQMTVYRTIEI